MSDIEIKKQFDEEFKRIAKFQRMFLGAKKADNKREAEFNSGAYAEYVLNEGTNAEKHELMGMFKNQLVLKNKQVKVEKKAEKA